MKNVILFRKSLSEENELDIVKNYFDVYEYRSQIPKNSLVIGRYSVLPFYNELETDLKNNDSKLINSYVQHLWVANFEYYDILKKFTFKTWTDNNFHKCDYDGPFVVKGKTNSRKFNWNTSMFARTKKDASIIASNLKSDSLIGPQDIIYREYVKLKEIEIGLNGLPFSNEWRFFYYKNKYLCHAYYWTIADDKSKINDEGAKKFADVIADIVQNYVNFFVLDVAQTENGNWKLVEINDGQMSGLSDNDPNKLYHELCINL